MVNILAFSSTPQNGIDKSFFKFNGFQSPLNPQVENLGNCLRKVSPDWHWGEQVFQGVFDSSHVIVTPFGFLSGTGHLLSVIQLNIIL